MPRIKCKLRLPGRPPDRELVTPEGYELRTTAEIEAAIEKGVTHEGIWTRMRRAWGDFVRSFTRHHSELEPVDDAFVVDLVRQFESAGEAGETKAVNWIVEITKRLTRKELAVFQRVMWMRDVLRDFEGGRRNLPFQMDEATFRDQVAYFEAVAAANSEVQAALDRRRAIARRVTERLVELKQLHPDVLKDDRYFHRQVLAHYEERRTMGLSARDVRNRKKGFQRARKEGLDQFDFNTDYFEAELEWLSQAAAKIQRVELLERLKEFLDVKSQLIRQAKALNEEIVMRLDREAAELPLGGVLPDNYKDPYQPFRQRIAIANSQLARLATAGQLWSGHNGEWDDLVEGLGDAFAEWKDLNADLDPDQRSPFGFEDARWFSFLADLARNEGVPGQLAALSVFKTLNDRRRFTEEYLKGKSIEPRTWSDLIPEGHTQWSPDTHPKFYPARTVTEKVIDQLLAGSVDGIEESDIRIVLARRPQEMWVIPANVATVFDHLAAPRTDVALERFSRRLNTIWKQWVLLNPYRAIKYNFNNMSGDLDIAIAYDWQILKGIWGAFRDLRKYVYHNEPLLSRARRAVTGKEIEPLSLAKRAELDAVLELGVGTSSITNQEIDRVAKELKSRVPGMNEHNIVVKRWEGIRRYTTIRENILRLAAFRYFKAQLAAGKKPLGASRREAVLELYDQIKAGKFSNEEMAAKLARELLGDYGNISEGGKWLREKLIPFYSWLEINAPRYYFLFQNAAHDDSGGSKVGGAVGSIVFKGTKGIAGAAIAVNAFSLLVMAFNYAMGNGDDMEEIFRNRRQLHLILGHDDEGNVQSLRMQGAWTDALDWFGVGDLPADINDFREDGAGVLEEKALDLLKSPINRMYRGLSPFYKTSAETMIGYRAYPDLLRSGDRFFDLAYQPVRDRGLEIARMWSAQDLYLRSWDTLYKIGAVKQPSPPAYDAKDVAQTLLVYKTDPGQSAYWEARIRASRWAEKELNVKRGSFGTTETGNALYWWRKSLQWGQEEKAREHLDHYAELRSLRGAKVSRILDDIARSTANQHPLVDIPDKHRLDYFGTLNQRQLDELNAAIGWWAKVYKVEP